MAFGGVWKESLSELSGGQKSLLALSLILAMLLFKPAPIYILDEVRPWGEGGGVQALVEVHHEGLCRGCRMAEGAREGVRQWWQTVHISVHALCGGGR